MNIVSAPDLLKALELARQCGADVSMSGAQVAFTQEQIAGFYAALTPSSVDAVPVAWQFRFKSDESEWLDCSELWAHMAAARTDCETRPLYAHPVPAKPDPKWPAIGYARNADTGWLESAELYNSLVRAPAAAVEGWQMVPKEPAPEMLGDDPAMREVIRQTYLQFLRLAPASPAAGPGLRPADVAAAIRSARLGWTENSGKAQALNVYASVENAIAALLPEPERAAFVKAAGGGA